MDKGTQRFEQAGKVDDPLTESFVRFRTAFASQDMVDSEIARPPFDRLRTNEVLTARGELVEP